MFYLNTIRKLPKAETIYEFECQLHEVLNSLTIKEIGIICAGFFKTQTKCHINEMVDNIILAIIKNHENINPVTLASICKVRIILSIYNTIDIYIK